MRFGYYLAGRSISTGERGVRKGDPELSQIAEELWNHYGTPTPGYHNTGASVWISNDQLTVNLIVPDFFSEAPKVCQVRKSKPFIQSSKPNTDQFTSFENLVNLRKHWISQGHKGVPDPYTKFP